MVDSCLKRYFPVNLRRGLWWSQKIRRTRRGCRMVAVEICFPPEPRFELRTWTGRIPPRRRRGCGMVAADHRLRPRLGAGDPRRDEIDARVDRDHDDQRQVEGADGRVQLVADLLADHALAGLVLRLADEKRRNADQRRQDPDGHDHGGHAHRGPLHGVLERTGDDEVAVDADGAEVQDGGGAEQDVQGRPHVADRLPERPAAHHLVHRGERHHHDRDEEVGHGQGDDQQVGRRPQSANDRDRRTDKDVSDNRSDDDDPARERDQHHRPRLVRALLRRAISGRVGRPVSGSRDVSEPRRRHRRRHGRRRRFAHCKPRSIPGYFFRSTRVRLCVLSEQYN